MKTKNAILELPAQQKELNEITADKHHEIISISLSSVATGDDFKHFALAVWKDGDESDHWHVGTTPGRTYSE